MKRVMSFLSISLLLAMTAIAEGAASSGVFNVTDFGAVADGKTDNTAAIQKAIDACNEAGGGTVRAAGGAFMTYTLYMRSNVRIEIEAGASLDGGPDPELYPEFEPSPHWKVEFSLRQNRRAMFYGAGVKNITIAGRGTINGHAELFHEQIEGTERWRRKSDTLITGRNLFLVGCRDVHLENYKILNPAGWSMWLLGCDRVNIHGIEIQADPRYPNGDGIHLGSCSDVTVSNCVVNSNDDAIVLRSYQHQLHERKPCERVVITNCILQSHASAVRIGWAHDYEVKDCRLSNLVIKNSTRGIAMILPPVKSKPKDPPQGPDVPPLPTGDALQPFGVENLHFSDISMECRYPIIFQFAPDAKISRIHNVTFSNMTVRSPEYPIFELQKGNNVSDILLSNVRFEILPGGKNNFNIRGVDRLTLDRVTFVDGAEQDPE